MGKSKLNILPDHADNEAKGRFPKWLHRPLPSGDNLFSTEEIVNKYKINTVCEEAKCPNRWECYGNKTATFLALGKACTRACGFCDIDFAKAPKLPEEDEPLRIANSIKELGLKHVVITMVARDDLPDGGASHIVNIIKEARALNEGVTIEVLTSDFAGNFEAIDLVLQEKPEVFNYNLETVERLTPRVRHKAKYRLTLDILKHAKQSGHPQFVKSGLMVGLGEKEDEVKAAIQDLYSVGVNIITIGQYLQASRCKLPVRTFIPPETFSMYKEFGESLGDLQVYSSPFVRSSYNAGEALWKSPS